MVMLGPHVAKRLLVLGAAAADGAQTADVVVIATSAGTNSLLVSILMQRDYTPKSDKHRI
jgi:hypothetical protein